MMRVKSSVTRWEIAAVIIILLMAAVLRLGDLDVVEFKRDEANLSQLALDFARGRSLPLLGISSSVGIPNSPVSVYLFAIPYLFSSDPTVATAFVGLLNVAAVLFTYLLARRYYGVLPALIAASLYAVSPWGVIYARKIWAQDILPSFVVATIGTGLLGFLEGKRWAQWLVLPLLCLTAQIHYSGLLLAIHVAYLMWIGRKKWTRAFYLSFIPTILLCIPFAIGILQADLPDISQLGFSAAENADTADGIRFSDDMLHFAALTVAGTEIHSLAGPRAFQDYLASVPDAYPLFGLLAWAVVLSGLWLLWRSWRKSDQRRIVDRLMLIWSVVPIIIFSLTWTTPYPHYLIIMMPAAFIIIGAGAGDLWASFSQQIALQRVVFGIVGGLLVLILALQVFLSISLMQFLRTTYTPGGFGAPLAYLLPVRDAVLASNTTDVLAQLDGQFVGFDDDTTVWNNLLYDVPSVRFLDENVRVEPATPALWLTRGCEAENGQVFQLRSVEEGCYHLSDQLLEFVSATSFEPIPDSPLFANGVRLTGYDFEADCFYLRWEITALSEKDYSFLVHFFDADGREIVNADGLSWRGVYWRTGDEVVRRFCLNPEQVALRADIRGVNLGMYIYDGVNFQNVDVLDSAGNPAGQIVIIPFESQ